MKVIIATPKPRQNKPNSLNREQVAIFPIVSGAQDSLNTQFKILESTVVHPIGIRTGVCQSSLRPGARGTVLTHAS